MVYSTLLLLPWRLSYDCPPNLTSVPQFTMVIVCQVFPEDGSGRILRATAVAVLDLQENYKDLTEKQDNYGTIQEGITLPKKDRY